jgi:hypothetical protein
MVSQRPSGRGSEKSSYHPRPSPPEISLTRRHIAVTLHPMRARASRFDSALDGLTAIARLTDLSASNIHVVKNIISEHSVGAWLFGRTTVWIARRRYRFDLEVFNLGRNTDAEKIIRRWMRNPELRVSRPFQYLSQDNLASETRRPFVPNLIAQV